jgi:hypothetical protein
MMDAGVSPRDLMGAPAPAAASTRGRDAPEKEKDKEKPLDAKAKEIQDLMPWMDEADLEFVTEKAKNPHSAPNPFMYFFRPDRSLLSAQQHQYWEATRTCAVDAAFFRREAEQKQREAARLEREAAALRVEQYERVVRPNAARLDDADEEQVAELAAEIARDPETQSYRLRARTVRMAHSGAKLALASVERQLNKFERMKQVARARLEKLMYFERTNKNFLDVSSLLLRVSPSEKKMQRQMEKANANLAKLERDMGQRDQMEAIAINNDELVASSSVAAITADTEFVREIQTMLMQAQRERGRGRSGRARAHTRAVPVPVAEEEEEEDPEAEAEAELARYRPRARARAPVRAPAAAVAALVRPSGATLAQARSGALMAHQ